MASTSDSAISDKRLLARVDDILEQVQRIGGARFVGFFDEREAVLIRQHTTRIGKTIVCRFFGGHAESERVMLGVGWSDEDVQEEAFPIASLEIRWRKNVSLSHRDVLGSLLGCGVARNKIGDILCEDGRAVVFVTEELAGYLSESLKTVGREGVDVSCPAAVPYPIFHRFREKTATIASARLDAVLKALLCISREQACDLIRKGLVQVNHLEAVSVSMPIHPADRLSVRGYGRYVVDDVSQQTKKGRYILCARQFV